MWHQGLGRWLRKCLIQKCEALVVIPRTHIKKTGIVAHACNPETKEAETGGSLGLPGLLGHPNLWISDEREACLKNEQTNK